MFLDAISHLLQRGSGLGILRAFGAAFGVCYGALWTVFESLGIPEALGIPGLWGSRQVWLLLLAPTLSMVTVRVAARRLRAQGPNQFLVEAQQCQTELAALARRLSFERSTRRRTELLTKAALNLLALALIMVPVRKGRVFGNLMLFDRRSRLLRIQLTQGFHHASAHERVFAVDGTPGEGSCGWAYRNQRNVIIPDASRDDRVARLPGDDFEKLGSLINIVLGRLGVLNIACDTPGTFTEEQQLLERIGLLQGLGLQLLELWANPPRPKRSGRSEKKRSGGGSQALPTPPSRSRSRWSGWSGARSGAGPGA
ncbi:MAG TPA: GAF domain-containing protein [Thermoanaerobaculia bacterium]|nr:GAF domain-containing protein [Thermoanaerobaculia bacterium]